MSGDLSFILDCSAICKTVKYIDQYDSSSHYVLGCDTTRYVRLIADWSVQNVNHRGCRGRDCMVVRFTTTYAISAYHH